MLHDPGSYTPLQKIHEIRLGRQETDILRKLGAELAHLVHALGLPQRVHKSVARAMLILVALSTGIICLNAVFRQQSRKS